ncbi:trace amine-associated receptor 13c-like [Protopterus annectens]|uniref:trace amine-associated receptor 13c-like n=1 Tax=Protopterus annectens TaxID=7888 RepID=UPI001CF93FAD|nr:trace amine-associated receptor 13c-like [Protopterus annectens]
MIFREPNNSEEGQYCFPNVNDSCYKESRSQTIKTALYILFSGGIITTVGGNTTVIISVANFKYLHTPTNFLILSLATTDLLVGLIVMPFSMIRTVESCWYFGDTACVLHSSFDVSLTTISIFHLIFIAIDRYYAICDPLLYCSKINNFVAGIFIAISWIVPGAYTYISLYSKIGTGMEKYVSSDICKGNCEVTFNAIWGVLDSLLTFFLPCMAMLAIYAKIFFIARKHAKAINVIKFNNDKQKINNPSETTDQKATKTLAIVMGVFVLSWLPLVTDATIDPYVNFSTPTAVSDALLWLGYFNSACNPIVYAFFYPWFQRALKLIATGNIFRTNSSNLNLFSNFKMV